MVFHKNFKEKFHKLYKAYNSGEIAYNEIFYSIWENESLKKYTNFVYCSLQINIWEFIKERTGWKKRF